MDFIELYVSQEILVALEAEQVAQATADET